MFGSLNSRMLSGTGRPPNLSWGVQSFGQEGEKAGTIRKVLVVDDEADVADLAEVLLTAHGLDTLVAYSAAEALDLLATHPDIDAVVSDVMMPGMNGLELADRIGKRYPEVKIVLASGYMAPTLAKGQPLRQLFIAKPYRIDQLLKLLQT